jgi:predicted acylesterase/phospholipase RssA
MNAAVLADGWVDGGAEGARAALEKFWQRVSRAAAFSALQRSPLDRLLGRWTLDTSPAYVFMDLMSRVLSPYALNPLDLNPLRRILAESVDFSRLANSPIKLFITATSVRTGRGRIFRNAEISAEVLLASACLPTMFRALKSTASHIGTVDLPEIPRSPRWFGKPMRTIRSWCRSIRANDRRRRAPQRTFSIGSMRFPSTRR